MFCVRVMLWALLNPKVGSMFFGLLSNIDRSSCGVVYCALAVGFLLGAPIGGVLTAIAIFLVPCKSPNPWDQQYPLFSGLVLRFQNRGSSVA